MVKSPPTQDLSRPDAPNSGQYGPIEFGASRRPLEAETRPTSLQARYLADCSATHTWLEPWRFAPPPFARREHRIDFLRRMPVNGIIKVGRHDAEVEARILAPLDPEDPTTTALAWHSTRSAPVASGPYKALPKSAPVALDGGLRVKSGL